MLYTKNHNFVAAPLLLGAQVSEPIHRAGMTRLSSSRHDDIADSAIEKTSLWDSMRENDV